MEIERRSETEVPTRPSKGVSSTSPWPDKEQAMKVLQVDVLEYLRQRREGGAGLQGPRFRRDDRVGGLQTKKEKPT